MKRSWIALQLGIGLLVGSCSAAGHGPTVERTDPRPAQVSSATLPRSTVTDTDVLRALDIEFGTSGALDSKGTTQADRILRYRAFVRDRLGQDAFLRLLLLKLFPNVFTPRVLPVVPLTLKAGRVGSREFYYLDQPCAADQLVSVRPWWEPTRQVSICRDSYRPELRADRRLGDPIYCEYSYDPEKGSRERICRCGARLLNCARDDAQQQALLQAWNDEPVMTAAHVIRSHRPFAELLTMGATVRSGLADFFYSRNEFYRGGRFELAERDAPAALRSRDAIHGGGILSTPHVLYVHDSQRVIAAWLWEDFLCIPLTSTNVHAEQMFAIKKTALRHHGHMELASMDGCRTCHARLENVVQVFAPVPTIRHGLRLQHGLPIERARFFGVDDRDERGEGPATFAWLGETLTRQPEFRTCIVRKVEEIVYKGMAVPPDVHQTLGAGFDAGLDLARLVEDAIVARYLGGRGLSETF